MRRTLLLGIVTLALSSIPVAASAARAYVLGGSQIFAGPGNDYPIVAQLGQGVAVNVNGCLSDYSWCDVNLGANRGWVYAGDLAYPYRNGRVPILEYGPRLSLPLITFSLGNYWDRYYRARPFYRERADWEHRWRERDRARFDERRDNRAREWRNDRRDARVNQERHDRARANQERVYQDRVDRSVGNQPGANRVAPVPGAAKEPGNE